MWKKVVIVSLCAILVQSDTLNDIYNCGDSVKCAEEKLIGLINDFDSKSSVSILDDLIVIEKSQESTGRSQEGIEDRILRYFNNHQVKIKFPSQRTMRSLVDEARKSKLKKIILPLLLFLKLKAAIILPAILFGIALVAFKGLGAGVMAFLVSGAVALKSLLEKHGSSTLTYEVIPQLPGSHWNRNGVEGLKFTPSYNNVPN